MTDIHTLDDLRPGNLRERVEAAKQNLLYRWMPFQAYQRLRTWRHMHFKDPEMRTLKFLVRADSISLDIGANLGLFTHLLGRYSTTVHAFEPNPTPYRLLKDGAARNVIVRNMAISDASGEVEFCIPRTRKGWSNNGGHVGAGTRTDADLVIRVPCARLDDLELADVGFIKIDVEGHELAVLRGGIRLIERWRPNLMVENEYPHVGADAVRVFDLLAQLDYEGYFLDRGVLRSLSHFSFEKFQIEPARSGARQDYVRNFIFLPR